MSYNTLNSYSKNTLSREDNQDYTVSKCYNNTCSIKSKDINQNDKNQNDINQNDIINLNNITYNTKSNNKLLYKYPSNKNS